MLYCLDLAHIAVIFGIFNLVQSSPSNFPPPVVPDNCGFPDCSILSNRYHEKALFPHPDPERYVWTCWFYLLSKICRASSSRIFQNNISVPLLLNFFSITLFKEFIPNDPWCLFIFRYYQCVPYNLNTWLPMERLLHNLKV